MNISGFQGRRTRSNINIKSAMIRFKIPTAAERSQSYLIFINLYHLQHFLFAVAIIHEPMSTFVDQWLILTSFQRLMSMFMDPQLS